MGFDCPINHPIRHDRQNNILGVAFGHVETFGCLLNYDVRSFFFRGGGTTQKCSSRQAHILTRLSPQDARGQSTIGLDPSLPDPQGG